ncbi:hypothetical protein ISS03_02795 [Patescibacteria group bacterium]|nr:hypothetical protein [Patescibacteria group bacterium]
MKFENIGLKPEKKENMLNYELVSTEEFIEHKEKLSDELKQYLTSFTDEQAKEQGVEFYLSTDKQTGFGLKQGNELVNLFSLIKGRGKYSVLKAMKMGAVKFDCFDKQEGQDKGLVEYYKKFGFTEVKRVPNWVEGEPDVVYMELPIKSKENL